MLTPEQLARIKYMNSNLEPEYVVNQLLAHIEYLSDAIKAKDAILSQFSDKENWTHVISNEYFVWDQPSNPIDLANQALNEGHE